MIAPSRVISKSLAKNGAFSGAAPKTVSGNPLDPRVAGVGSLSAWIDYLITTNTITFTAAWEVSSDGTNWYPARPGNAPANVAIATGNGGLVTSAVAISAPEAVYGAKYARVSVTTGVGAGGGAGVDEVTISYSYRKPFNGN